MRELYLLGCLVLGTGAVFATMSVVKYTHVESPKINEEIAWVPNDEKQKDGPQPTNYNADIIHTRNAFDESRGKEEPVVAANDDDDDTPPQGQYSFELRGINAVGEKKMALVTATPVRTSRSSSSRNSRSSGRNTTPVRSSASKILIVAEGKEIGETGYKIDNINAGKVKIVDSKGEHETTLTFSLASAESLKRAEASYKNELSRQKKFARQNTVEQPKKPTTSAPKQPATPTTKPTDPKKMTKEQREAEMRKRAENLKAEMKRLKELRDQQKREEKDKRKDGK